MQRLIQSLAFILILVLGACSTPPPAPIVERPQPPSEKINYHIVSSGESLYIIAWRYEMDYQRLALANNLSSPYKIYKGQRLTLDLSRARASAKGTAGKASRNVSVSPKAVPYDVKPSLGKVSKTQKTATIKKMPSLPKSGWHWGWPVKGRVAREYDTSRVFKGINIYSKAGKPVTVAAPGVVVYAGNGLRGYGQLIIVKHSETYLSAYAFNREILVKENQQVKSGGRIAMVGGDTSNPDRLYFEIRKNGKPVDPLRLLPRQ